MAHANGPKSHLLEKECQGEDDHDIITGIAPKQGEHDHIDVSPPNRLTHRETRWGKIHKREVNLATREGHQ